MRLALAFLFTMTILGAGRVYADSTSMKSVESLGKMVAEMSQQVLLEPLVASLRARAQHDPKLRSLLGKLDVRVSPLPKAKWGRNAIATFENGRLVVLTDSLFLNEMMSYAYFSGLGASGLKEADPIAYQVCLNYGAAIGRYAKEGGDFPAFSFREADLPEGVMKTVTEHLGHEVIKGTIAWLALHEIAHHRLGHLTKKARTLKMVRNQEFAADAWAFDTMVKLGYQLWPLDYLFYALETMEQIRIAVGVDVAEDLSDHPTWANRHKALTRRYDVNRATSGLYLTFITFGPGADGKTQDYIWIVPRNPDEGGYMFALLRQDMLPFEWLNGNVILYSRDAATRTTITLIDPERSRFDIEAQVTEVATGQVLQNNRTIGTHIDFADLTSREIAAGLTLAGIIEKTPLAFLLNAVAEIHSSAKERSAIKRIYKATFAKQRKSLVAYGKGQIDFSAAAKQMTDSEAQAKEQVRTLLGEQRFSRFIEALLATPAAQFGIQKLETRMRSATEGQH